ncbi:NAD(P)-binding protein [Schizopora paradoxa]|uniref:D-xylose 1-dehydrogenase (NADP(+), D-xylono-1,5-lactone-forming) n=1 Tax=Schizopora paradoxa TaxID=27342 RepID=A0A0H2RIJ2_9AGAM|nr:NAD(P)-binding protein [Schizopora paradoxa]
MSVKELKWGIISTGWIAGCFVRDILGDPSSRGVSDVAHKIVAVGSRSVQAAQDFIDREIKDPSVKAYGTYEEMLADPSVEAVYIGTPHTLHFSNAKASLLAKKHVLCEKPITINTAELHSLIAIAKEQGVFLMEALWTRFQPLALEFKKIAESGELGDPVSLHADLSGDFDIENIPKTHRILDPMLGGGALLDLGPYPLVWAIMALYEHPKNKAAKPERITGSMSKTLLTGVDAFTSFTLTFTGGLNAQAILSDCITLPAPNPGVIVRYRNGTILVAPPIYSPRSFTVQYFDKPGSGVIAREEVKKFEYVGKGWHFQADEVARCVRDGKLESEVWTHAKSILEMEIFDEVRKQGGYVFPPGVEQVV